MKVKDIIKGIFKGIFDIFTSEPIESMVKLSISIVTLYILGIGFKIEEINIMNRIMFSYLIPLAFIFWSIKPTINYFAEKIDNQNIDKFLEEEEIE